MSAPAAAPRPVLYLVPGAGPAAEGRPSRRPARPRTVLPTLAAGVTARVLGTVFAPVAHRLALALTVQAPLLVRRGRPDPWAAAIAYLLAEEARLFEHDPHVTRTSFARELGATLPTLRRRADAVRAALAPLHLDLPDPDPDQD